ncbi:MAG: HAD family phosphatase [Solirubrobacteraceae bacterium]|nr:HAD family phosphatase [Solirubrobacteraceae bacterium]
MPMTPSDDQDPGAASAPDDRAVPSARPAAVLFDCDGVLIDTEVTSAHVLAEQLTAAGVPTDADELREVIKGTSLGFLAEESARRLGVQAVPGDWMDRFIETRLVEYRRGVEQLTGAAEAVTAVKAAGIPIAIVSQGSRQKMSVTLPASGMDRVIGDAPIFSGDDVERGKPNPDLYLLAASRLGVDPADCVVVEDSPPGVTGAHAAGMRVLGYAVDSDPERMRAAGAEVFFDLHEVAWRVGIASQPPATA